VDKFETERFISAIALAGGRTLIPKNAFSWRVPHPMVLRVRVLTFFQPGTPGIGWAMGRKRKPQVEKRNLGQPARGVKTAA
jgi:hypothetical protein